MIEVAVIQYRLEMIGKAGIEARTVQQDQHRIIWGKEFTFLQRHKDIQLINRRGAETQSVFQVIVGAASAANC